MAREVEYSLAEQKCEQPAEELQIESALSV
jgi:hypothetical protein